MQLLLRKILTSVETIATTSLSTLIGTPAGASVSADIASIKADVDTLEARLEATTVGVRPTLASAVIVTADAVAWTLGAFATLLSAAGIATDFYVDGAQVEAVSASLTGELVLYYGVSDTEFARVRFTGTNGNFRFPPVKIAGGAAIKAKLATAAGGSQTASVSFTFHQ